MLGMAQGVVFCDPKLEFKGFGGFASPGIHARIKLNFSKSSMEKDSSIKLESHSISVMSSY